MSSISGNQSPRFIPPQSAQPYTSLFGGSSSQDVPDLEPYPLTQQGAAFYPNELDTIMEDRSLIEENDFPDNGSTYNDSGDDGSDLDSQPDLPTPESKIDKTRDTLPPTTYQQVPSSPPSSPSFRPNRFRGPESTWRKLTVEDRQNAEALENIRARNLAAHLYNAYALRIRAREIARRAAENDESLDPTEAFAPPKRWTLWPLPASEVPRANEHLRRLEDEASTFKMRSDPRPSAELEESIIAMMVKSAKERFNSRPWQTRRGSSYKRDNTPLSQEESNGMDIDVKSEAESAYNPSKAPPMRPVVQADDDKSRQQLRPLTRNVITQLGRILHGLHHARKGAMGADDSSASEWQTDAESIVSGRSSPRKRRSNGHRDRSISRGRKRTRRSSNASKSRTDRSQTSYQSTERPESQGASKSRGRSGPRSASRMRLGARDWSQVLGVASMVGVPPAVVMRTAQRCASLFGEDMAFQTLKEGRLRQAQEDRAGSWVYAESESEESEASLPSPPPKPKRGRSRATSRATSRAASVKGDSKSQATSRATSRATSQATSPVRDNIEGTVELKGKGPHRKNDILCPVKTCRRHTDGFTRTWNLNLHLKRVHPGYRPRNIDVKSPAPVRTEDEDE